jgi:hypothetical protein
MLKYSRLTTSGNMVKVYVGEVKKLWYIHEDLLCERSEYFKKAFQGGFKEGYEKEIYLTELDPKAFGQFVDWVYGAPLQVTVPTGPRRGGHPEPAPWPRRSKTPKSAPGHRYGELPKLRYSELPGPRNGEPSAAEFEQAFLFCKIYAAAQYLQMENLQNDAMDMYSSYIQSGQRFFNTTSFIASAHVEYIYTNTNRPSPMHEFMAGLVAKAIVGATVTGEWDSVMEKCPEFAIDIVLKIQKLQTRGEKDGLTVPRCTFHVHEYTAKCAPVEPDDETDDGIDDGISMPWHPRREGWERSRG